MLTLGLTGGIGMGKSTAAGLLSGVGVPVIDTDVLARDLVEPGRPALAEIQEAFGSGLLDSTGRLRRDELAHRVFPDPSLRKRLEGILHPKIRIAWRSQVQSWRSEGRRACAVVVPLLFEVGAEGEFDAVLCVACSVRSQMARLKPRHWTDEQIRQRIAAQLPAERKMERSDFVVWTEGALGPHLDQLKLILGSLGLP